MKQSTWSFSPLAEPQQTSSSFQDYIIQQVYCKWYIALTLIYNWGSKPSFPRGWRKCDVNENRLWPAFAQICNASPTVKNYTSTGEIVDPSPNADLLLGWLFIMQECTSHHQPASHIILIVLFSTILTHCSTLFMFPKIRALGSSSSVLVARRYAWRRRAFPSLTKTLTFKLHVCSWNHALISAICKTFVDRVS